MSTTNTQTQNTTEAAVLNPVAQDFVRAVFVVSIFANVTVFVTWLAVMV